MKISDEVKFLEEAFDILNKIYFENALSKIAITIQSTPGAYGHFTPHETWKQGEKAFKEINIGADTLNRPIEDIISTLMHEMVHFYCDTNGIKDTSRGNTYHNKKFKEEAEKRDLIIEYDKRIGYSVTTPGKGIIDLCEQYNWQDKIKLYRNGKYIDLDKATAKQSSTRKYICPCCAMSVRATRKVNILCMDCNEQMVVPEF